MENVLSKPRRSLAGTCLVLALAVVTVAITGIVRNTDAPSERDSAAELLSSAGGIAVDAAGNLYLSTEVAAERGSVGQVLKVDPKGHFSIVAGNGQYGGPIPGPATASPLIKPDSVAVDAAGNLYVSTIVASVLKVSTDGNLSVVAGNDRLSLPVRGQVSITDLLRGELQLAADANGNLYAADFDTHVVVKIAPDGSRAIIAGNGAEGDPIPGPATSSPLSDPRGMAVDSAGNLYLGQSYVASIRSSRSWVVKITPNGLLSIVAGNGEDGEVIPGPASASPLNLLSPSIQQSVAVDAEDNLYVASWNRVAKITPDGALSIAAGSGRFQLKNTLPIPGPAIDSPLLTWRGIAVDAPGNLYIIGQTTVAKVTPNGMLSIILD
jgi:sugar lactone lactonase YvrE